MNQLIHMSPTLVLHQLGWGIPHAMWRNHAYAFYLVSITNGNGNKKFSLAWTVVGTALLTDAPSRVSSFYQWQCFCLVYTDFETLCSNDI